MSTPSEDRRAASPYRSFEGSRTVIFGNDRRADLRGHITRGDRTVILGRTA
jgi:hypothetical protein